MPFAYYGAKHGLAAHYPPPRFSTIIEPFAGAAGYSCRHATSAHAVLLNDLDPVVVALWQRLATMTPADLFAIAPELGKRTTELLVAGCGGAGSWVPVAGGKSRQITPRMVKDWPTVRRRILKALPNLPAWRIVAGDFHDLPDCEATWFIDPPYQPLGTMAGAGYRQNSIDYADLGEWCKSRRGQVIVCEQSPASWLPFQPFRTQRHAGGSKVGATRVEVVWYSDAVTLFPGE